jgi:cardiolipin synthase
MKLGAKIYVYNVGFIHAKTFISDGEVAVVSTANLDFRSSVHHFECATLMLKNSAINDIYGDFNRLFEYDCRTVNEKDLQLKWHEKLIKSLMVLFEPLM